MHDKFDEIFKVNNVNIKPLTEKECKDILAQKVRETEQQLKKMEILRNVK